MNTIERKVEPATHDRGDTADDIGEAPTLLPRPSGGLAAAVERAQVFEALFQEPARPQTLGRYVLLGTLGQGGMGTVFKAFDRALDRKVAVKVLHQGLDDRHTARLLREARAMARLSHPNVVKVFEVDTVGDKTFVAMELVHGQTLMDWIRQDPPPHWRRCVEMFIQVGQGLAAAHAEGFIHRDFNPGNAIVDERGHARVLDFGLVRRVEADMADDDELEHTSSQMMRTHGNDELVPDVPLTKTGAILGTPAYMPPEQMFGRKVDARSDQFSFCASLYEAVYGERPFEGGTLMELVHSMTNDGIRAAPKGSPVPARLRRLLLRGLAADPVMRWPSMDALLYELHALVAPRRRRWVALGLTVGLVGLAGLAGLVGLVGLGGLGGLGGILGQYVAVEERCTGAPAQMDGVWDDTRRQQVKTAILSTEHSLAPSTWAQIEPRLDEYAQAWMDTHTENCKATSVRREQTERAMDLRMRCLQKHRTTLRAAVDVLAEADAKVVEHAVRLVGDLPTLTRCEDLDRLERQAQRMPPPEDSDVASEVEALRERLADIKAMTKAGRYAEGLEMVEPVMQQAEEFGYPPLLAETHYWRGALRGDNGQYADAEQDLRQAHALAVEHHDDPVALQAALALASVVVELGRATEAQQWVEMVVLPLAQRSGNLRGQAASLTVLGKVFADQGDYDSALIHLQRALAINEHTLGSDDPDLADNLDDLGAVFLARAEYDDARLHLQRALAIKQNALGPDHPGLADSLGNLGAVFLALADYDDARLHLQRAMAIRHKALGPDHPRVAANHRGLGHVFVREGDWDDAQRHYRQALAIDEQALGPDHPQVAGDLSNLGDVSRRKGDWDDARLHYQRALVIGERALGPDHPDVAHLLVRLAMVALDTGDPASARVHAERAISVCEAATGVPRRLAEARFVLARALWSKRPARARAHALAEQARDALAAGKGPGEVGVALDDVDAWLATHRVK